MWKTRGGEASEKVDGLNQRRPGRETVERRRCSRTRVLEKNHQK